MKKVVRLLVLNVIGLKTVAVLIPSIDFNQGFKTVILTALALTVFEYTVKPIAKLLFLPITILTLGAIRWVINIIGLYLITIIIEDFSIKPYSFPGLEWQGVIIPLISFSLIPTYLIVSLLINLIVTSLRRLFGK